METERIDVSIVIARRLEAKKVNDVSFVLDGRLGASMINFLFVLDAELRKRI